MQSTNCNCTLYNTWPSATRRWSHQTLPRVTRQYSKRDSTMAVVAAGQFRAQQRRGKPLRWALAALSWLPERAPSGASGVLSPAGSRGRAPRKSSGPAAGRPRHCTPSRSLACKSVNLSGSRDTKLVAECTPNCTRHGPIVTTPVPKAKVVQVSGE